MKYDPRKLTAAQFALARRFEAAGLTSISQAVKAFIRRDNDQIEQWKTEMNAKEKK